MRAQQPNIVWRPLPGSQTLGISCACNHIFLDGTRGYGKTDTQLMYFRKHVGRGYGRFWRGVIFDREYKMLDDLVAKSQKWFPQLGGEARFLSSKADYKWVWPDGEELLFRQIKRSEDYWNYHGHEFPFIGWNELTKYPTSELYDSMMSCNRSSFLPSEHAPINRRTGERLPMSDIPLVVFSTTNPYGPGHNWVKRRFVDVAPPGKIVRTTTEVYNPRTRQKEPVTKTQVRIFGSYRENRYLSPEYIADLVRITDEAKRRAWLGGDWTIVAGGALDDVWIKSRIEIPRFVVPRTWRLDRTLDWGSAKPFSVGWWAEANGEEAQLPDGTRFCPPRGTLIRIAEWYGSKEIGSNKGLNLTARAVANGIVERENKLRAKGWISGPVYAGPADNAIESTDEASQESIATMMRSEGVSWTESNKSPGSRKNGFELVRARLEASVKYRHEKPGLYVTNNCRAAIALLPSLPRDPENSDDVDTDAEDHIYDELRYRVLAGSNRIATGVRIQFPT